MEAESPSTAMHDAYARGDHREARAFAKRLLSELPVGDEARSDAEEILRHTEPDPFIYVLVFLGLGLLVWLVYKYVL